MSALEALGRIGVIPGRQPRADPSGFERCAASTSWFGPATPFRAVTEGLCLGVCPQVHMAVGLDPGVPGGYEAVRRIVPLRGRREQTEVVLPGESAWEISPGAVCPALRLLAVMLEHNQAKSL